LRIPKIKREIICSICAENQEHHNHLMPNHRFSPRNETAEEAAYRQGWEDGSNKIADRMHWGLGWD